MSQKKRYTSRRERRGRSRTMAQSGSAPQEASQETGSASAALPARSSPSRVSPRAPAVPAPRDYSYVRRELRTISMLTGLLVIAIIVLALILR